jgi:hypothetical protein
MNFVFLSPHFPPNYYRFAVALKNHAITVLGRKGILYSRLGHVAHRALGTAFAERDLPLQP